METPYLGFWEKLPRPFFVLAPLANITDYSFRQFMTRYRKPDVLWTEFVAADGLVHPKGREALIRDLKFDDNERPIVAQLFTGHPENMFEAAKLVQELGFDGIDINMGCPDKNVMKQGAGAACMKDPDLAQKVIQAAMEGVRADGKEPIPVSVKTRLGFNQDTLEEWLPKILETKPAAITLHLRTKKEMSLVPAHWERMARAVEIARGSGTLILGNGDIKTVAEGRQKCAETGCDGIMIGRGVFGNPWVFDETKTTVTVRERLEAMLVLTDIFTTTWGETKSFELLKKHFQAYIVGFSGARELRAELMLTKNGLEVGTVLRTYLEEHGEVSRTAIELYSGR
ncbi:MAG: tRNA dihydrouridine synthase [Undibacterium sp.]